MHQRKKQTTNGCRMLKKSEPSDLYMACLRKDVESVRQLDSRAAFIDRNKPEADGSTALHAASSSGHAETVHVLLNNLDTFQLQQKSHGQTVCQLAVDHDIPRLPTKPSNSQRFSVQMSDCDMKNTFCVINYDKKSKDKNTRKTSEFIGKTEGKGDIAQMRTGIWLMKRAVASTHLRPLLLEIGRQLDPEGRYHDENMVLEIMQRVLDERVTKFHSLYPAACALLNEYAESGNLEPLFTLNTLSTPFCSYMSKNTSGLFGLYYGLHTLKPRSFQGTCYRGLSLTRKHLHEYEWAYRHNTKRVIYTRSFWSTSVDHTVSEMFGSSDTNSDQINVLMIFSFPEPCDTAVRLYRISEKHQCISYFQDELEVLITPGTLFRVIYLDINENSKKCTMYLENVRDKFELLPLIKCFWNIKSMLRQIGN